MSSKASQELINIFVCYSIVWCNIWRRWGGCIFQLQIVGILGLHFCLCFTNSSVCLFQIMGSIDRTFDWHGWLPIHWNSRMEKKETAILLKSTSKKIILFHKLLYIYTSSKLQNRETQLDLYLCCSITQIQNYFYTYLNHNFRLNVCP